MQRSLLFWFYFLLLSFWGWGLHPLSNAKDGQGGWLRILDIGSSSVSRGKRSFFLYIYIYIYIFFTDFCLIDATAFGYLS